MSLSDESGTVVIPTGEKLLYKSELFDVIIRNKSTRPGLTRDHYLVSVEVLEQDPLVHQTALLDIPHDVWSALSIGERVKARLYEQPDKRWTTLPPTGVR